MIVLGGCAASRRDEGDRSGRTESAPTVTEGARGRCFHGVDEGLSVFIGEADPEEVSFASVRILIVAGGKRGDALEEEVPGGGLAEEFFLLRFLTVDFYHYTLSAAAHLKEGGCGCGWIEGAQGIVARKRSEQSFDFGEVGGKRVPPVAKAVVDYSSTLKNLLHALRFFASDADDHIGEFVQAEVLFHYGAYADEAGVFFGVADGNLVGKRHGL